MAQPPYKGYMIGIIVLIWPIILIEMMLASLVIWDYIDERI